MTEWASTKYLPNVNSEIGTIASNEDMNILNINHAICDGKYIVGVAEHIGDSPKSLSGSYFPTTLDEEFSVEVKERLQNPPKFFRNDKNNTIFHGFGMKKTPTELLYDEFYDTKTISNYDPNKKLCKNLTSAIVTGYSLSAMALQGDKELTHIGGSMACYLRNELRNHKSVLDTNWTQIRKTDHDWCIILYLYNMCIKGAFDFAIPLLTYVIIDDKNDRNVSFSDQIRR